MGHPWQSANRGRIRTHDDVQLHTVEGKWIGYQILAGVGRGATLNMPIISVQEEIAGPEIAVATGTTALPITTVLIAYNEVLVKVFFILTATAGIALILSFGFPGTNLGADDKKTEAEESVVEL